MGSFMAAGQEAHPGRALISPVPTAHAGVTVPLADRFSLNACSHAASKPKGVSHRWHLNGDFICIKASETHDKPVGRLEKQLLLTSFYR